MLNKISKYKTNWIQHVGFEVLTAAVMKKSIFWQITPGSPLEVNRRFGGTSSASTSQEKIRMKRSVG
jgi:hypothetical protein